MAEKPNWFALSHEDRVAALQGSSLDQLVIDYGLSGVTAADFKRRLAAEASLWQPGNIAEFRPAGGPPTKDMVLGAYRDLDRGEAILELIDNSIDAWLTRQIAYPKATAAELDVYIDIDVSTGRLMYEDNAGGLKEEKLANLVVPGFSDTTSLSQTIGSYKTGGKKAIFRLATAARIDTRYWNPVGTSHEAFSVQLDEQWMNDPARYDFPYAVLKNAGNLENGQTIYTLQLREEPKGAPWYQSPDQITRITDVIRRTYSLLIVRHPKINLHVMNRKQPVQPMPELYDFTDAHDTDTRRNNFDVRPQRVNFEFTLEHEGTPHELVVELVIGCRTTTGVTEGRSWGFDLYGNDRLFVAYDQETFLDFLPKGNVQRRVRGYVNIRGPNVFIPWDTHKRHLNHDREIMQILRSHPLIKKVFLNWWDAFQDIANFARGEGTALVGKPMVGSFDKHAADFVVPHDATLKIDPSRRRRVELPKGFYVPKVIASSKKKTDAIAIKFHVSSEDARLLMTYFGLEGDIDGHELSNTIREDVLGRALRPTDRGNPRHSKRKK